MKMYQGKLYEHSFINTAPLQTQTTEHLCPQESINGPLPSIIYSPIQRIVSCNQGNTLNLRRHIKPERYGGSFSLLVFAELCFLLERGKKGNTNLYKGPR